MKGGSIQLARSFNSHDVSVLNFAIKIFFKCVCVFNVNSCLEVVFHLMKLKDLVGMEGHFHVYFTFVHEFRYG